jgi:hypothetical protein
MAPTAVHQRWWVVERVPAATGSVGSIGSLVSTVLVVVIAGVIIVAIAVATLRGDPKPATGAARPDRATTWEPAAFPPPPESELLDEVEPSIQGVADERSLLHRLRSMALLGVTVVVLGSLAAGLLGALAVVAAHAIDRALG